MMPLRTHDAGAGHETDHRSGGKKRAEQTVRREDADEGERYQRSDDERVV